MSTYLNKNMIDGVEELPRLTEEEFEAIPVAERPKIWVKRNATETDRGITAEDVQYSSTQSTKDKIDSMITSISGKATMAFYYHSSGQSLTIPFNGIAWIAVSGDGSDYGGLYICTSNTANKVYSNLTTHPTVANNVITMPTGGYYRCEVIMLE